MWSDGAVNDRRTSLATTRNEPVRDDPGSLRRLAEQVVTEAVAHLHTLPRPWEQRPAGAALPGVSTKSTPTDVVTASDTALEALVRERLAQLRPGDAVVGRKAAAPPRPAR